MALGDLTQHAARRGLLASRGSTERPVGVAVAGEQVDQTDLLVKGSEAGRFQACSGAKTLAWMLVAFLGASSKMMSQRWKGNLFT